MEEKITFSEFDDIFLEKSWEWLNDQEIKKLTNTISFSKEEQQLWYKRIKNQKNYRIWGVKYEDVPIGACGIKNITNIDCEYWGYIGEKKFWGMGFGYQMMRMIEEIVHDMKIKTIWLKVLKDNQRALRLYMSLNYKVELEDNEFIILRKTI